MSTTESAERWLYLGRRLHASTNKLNYVWQTEDGQEFWFGKLKASRVGGRYEVNVTRDEAGEFKTAKLAVTWIDDPAEYKDRVAVWQAMTEASVAAKSRADLERRKDSQLDDALSDLEEIVASCRSFNELEAIQEVVRQRIQRMWDSSRLTDSRRKTKDMERRYNEMVKHAARTDSTLEKAKGSLKKRGYDLRPSGAIVPIRKDDDA